MLSGPTFPHVFGVAHDYEGFWENLDAALVEIYPANPDHIDLPASRSTYHPTAFAGVAD